MSEFAHRRSEYRAAEVRAGRRSPGVSITLHQNMWARWIEVAVDQELRAVQDITKLLEGDVSRLTDEFHASLLAVTSSAYSIEALYAEVKYRIPPPTRRAPARDSLLAGAFGTAFGLPETELRQMMSHFQWLFRLRDQAVHPYTKPAVPEYHPAGINTGKENAAFNAVTSGRAVDAAMLLLDTAASPPAPLNRWIERWVESRAPYMVNVVHPLQARRASERELILEHLAREES